MQPLPCEDLPKDLAAAAQSLSSRLLRGDGKRVASSSLAQVLQPVAAELAPDLRALLPAVLLRAGDSLKFI